MALFFEEDFEGSTLCYTGYTSNCRRTYDVVEKGTGEVVDFDAAATDWPCSGGGTQALLISTNGGGTGTDLVSVVHVMPTAKSTVYLSWMHMITSESIPADSDLFCIDFYDAAGETYIGSLEFRKVGSLVKVKAHGEPGGSVGSTTIELNTWYWLGLKISPTELVCYINGDVECSTNPATADNKGVVVFTIDSDSHDVAGSYLIKNIMMDDAELPNPCSVSSIEQEGFRFRNDDGDEDGATWKANQDTNITLAADTAFRLRDILNATGDPASIGAQLEYRHKPSGGAFGDWKKVN